MTSRIIPIFVPKPMRACSGYLSKRRRVDTLEDKRSITGVAGEMMGWDPRRAGILAPDYFGLQQL